MSRRLDPSNAFAGRLPSDAELAVIRNYPVLYVDDELHNINVFEASFGDDFNIVTAMSGQEALELLATQDIAVVVSDNRMPGMLGVELLSHVYEQRPEIRRVLCTAYSDQQTAIDAINIAAVQHYVVKPWESREMSALLRELVADVHLERAANHLRTDLVEREREACIAALRRRFEQDLGNVLSVLRGVDHGLRVLHQDVAAVDRNSPKPAPCSPIQTPASSSMIWPALSLRSADCTSLRAALASGQR